MTPCQLKTNVRFLTFIFYLLFCLNFCLQEVNEYKAMLSKTQKLPDFQDSWKAEIGNIVADLSAEYEAQLHAMTAALETRHAEEVKNSPIPLPKKQKQQQQIYLYALKLLEN